MVADEKSNFPFAQKLVHICSYIIFAAVLYGIALAHIPAIIGVPWSTCKLGGSMVGCILTFHLFEVPIVLFNTYLVWYGLKRFAAQTLRTYLSLLVFAAIFNFVFFAFEINLLLASLQREAPTWEDFGLTSLAVIMLCGTALVTYLHQYLKDHIRDNS